MTYNIFTQPEWELQDAFSTADLLGPGNTGVQTDLLRAAALGIVGRLWHPLPVRPAAHPNYNHQKRVPTLPNVLRHVGPAENYWHLLICTEYGLEPSAFC